MRVSVEITDGQALHVSEHARAQTQHGALGDVDHQAVVGVRANHAHQQHGRQGEQRVCQRSEVGMGLLR